MTDPNNPLVPVEPPRDWDDAELHAASGPALPGEPPEVTALREELARQAEERGRRDRADMERQALAAQTELGHSLAEDVARLLAVGEAAHAVPDLKVANRDQYDRPHFLRSVEGEPDRCGQCGELWTCSTWQNVIRPRIAAESAGGVQVVPVPAIDERQAAAAALLGISVDQLDTMLQRHDSAER